MIATLKRGYVVVALVVVLLASMAGWTMKTEMAAALHHTSVIPTTQQSTAFNPRIECPPPPYNCG
nr:hypothetical protein [Ktedonobacteraceae bacterium]